MLHKREKHGIYHAVLFLFGMSLRGFCCIAVLFTYIQKLGNAFSYDKGVYI